MTDISREAVEALHELVTIDAVSGEIDRRLAGHICGTLLALAAERDALEAKLAERVTVKPLIDGPDFVRDALGDAYFVEKQDGVWGYHRPGRGGFVFGGYGMPNDSREDMLAIIQRGCERRILSALEPAPITVQQAAEVLNEAMFDAMLADAMNDLVNGNRGIVPESADAFYDSGRGEFTDARIIAALTALAQEGESDG